jgi:hypothetical protein
MILRGPFKISARLLPSLEIAGASVQLEYSNRPGSDSGRVRYRWTIDLPDGGEHSADDLQSGRGGGSLLEGFASLLSFLGAAAEGGENADLFPAPIVAWAATCSDEIAMLAFEIEETGNATFIEE